MRDNMPGTTRSGWGEGSIVFCALGSKVIIWLMGTNETRKGSHRETVVVVAVYAFVVVLRALFAATTKSNGQNGFTRTQTNRNRMEEPFIHYDPGIFASCAVCVRVTCFVSLGVSRQIVGRPVRAVMAFRASQALRMVVTKTSTGLVGLAVDVNGRANLIALQKKILESVKVRHETHMRRLTEDEDIRKR